MKAIVTKYLPFTNIKPSRIKASAEGVKSVIRSCDELEGFARSVHIQAAHLFCADNNWSGNLASGQLPNGDWAHCFIPDNHKVEKAIRVIEDLPIVTDQSLADLLEELKA